MKSNELINVLGALGAAVRWRDLALQDIEELIVEARDCGASWTDIGERLGVTRQTAQRVYGENRERVLEERREASIVRAETLRLAGVPIG